MLTYFEWHILPNEEDLDRLYGGSDDQYPVVRQFRRPNGDEIPSFSTFCSGKRVIGWDANSYCEVHNTNKIIMDSVSCLGGAKLVSKRSSDGIQQFVGQQVQCLPVRVRTGNSVSPIRRHFSILNPLLILDPIDMKKTKSVVRKGVRYANPSRNKLRLTRSSIDAEAMIFRTRYLEQMVVVDERFVAYVKKKKYTGFRFDELTTEE